MSAEKTLSVSGIWWRLKSYSSEIEEFTVVKTTLQTVWFKARDWNGKELPNVRQERKGDDWYPTKPQAIAAQRERLERSEESARNKYSQAVQKLKEFNVMHAGELGK